MFWIVLFAYIIKTGFEWFLEFLNYRWTLKYGCVIPTEFKGSVDPQRLKQACNYTLDKIRFGFIESFFSEVVLILFIFCGLLDRYNSYIYKLNFGFVSSGVIFFVLLSVISTFLKIPFLLYRTFKIEKKYGFNTMTVKLWLTDFCKTLFIEIILQSLLFGIAFFIMQKIQNFWWLPVWIFFLCFSVFLMYISPYVLEPLFNKFTPIENEELEKDIKQVLEKGGIKISRIFKMDASKRTKHSNAYFTGIGKVKRIILFDTLLSQMNKEEIIAVLAHEAGHWKKKHLFKMLCIFEIFSLVGIYTAFLLTNSDVLTNVFHIKHETFFVKIVLLMFIVEIVIFPIYPLFNMLSRLFEKEADTFACRLTGTCKNLISALIKLCKENLTNLNPYPLYAKFYYSHPPVQERIRYLKEIDSNFRE